MTSSQSHEPVAKSQRWRKIVLAAGFAVAVAMVVAVTMPLKSGAWPFQNPKSIHVTGQIQCNNIDSGRSFGGAKVQGFEIRGRSNVMRDGTGTGKAVTYSVDVPPGWTIEWSVRCSGMQTWQSGSFPVDTKTIGSSYEQSRNICTPGLVAFAPCVVDEWGGCVMLWATGGWKPDIPKTEDAVFALQDYAGGGQSDIAACAAAVKSILPKLSAQAAPPKQTTATPLPSPIVESATPLPPVPTTPSATDSGPSPSPQGSPGPTAGPTNSPGPTQTYAPAPTAQATTAAPIPSDPVVEIYNKVTNGMSMVEDTPAYLSTVTENYCASRGCKIGGTEMSSGARLTVVCQAVGPRTTNGDDVNPADDANPNRFESTTWYGGLTPDGHLLQTLL